MACNRTLDAVDDSMLHMCFYYFGTGLFAAGVEAVNLGVMLRAPHAFSNNFFILCLKFANFFNGVSYVVLGAERYWLISTETFAGPTTYRDCFFGSVVPSFLIVGTSLPALIVLVIAADRFMAVLEPAKYRMYAGPRTKLASLPVLLVLQMAFVLLAAIPAMGGGGCKNARWCTIITSTSDLYALFHFSFITLSHFAGFSSMLLLLKLTKTSSGLSKATKKNIMLGLLETGSYALCVALPSAVMVARVFAKWSASILIDVVSLCIPTVAIASFILNFACRKEHRRPLRSLCNGGRTGSKTTMVQPSTATMSRGAGKARPKPK